MKVAKVIGTIWATRKEDKLAGLKLLLVQPINVLTGGKDRCPMVAADIIGARRGRDGAGGRRQLRPERGRGYEHPCGRHCCGHRGRSGDRRERPPGRLSGVLVKGMVLI